MRLRAVIKLLVLQYESQGISGELTRRPGLRAVLQAKHITVVVIELQRLKCSAKFCLFCESQGHGRENLEPCNMP